MFHPSITRRKEQSNRICKRQLRGVVEGEHRAYVTDFIRDARAGGCAVGKPPSNLGFRLVRDDAPAGFISFRLSRLSAVFHWRPE